MKKTGLSGKMPAPLPSGRARIKSMKKPLLLLLAAVALAACDSETRKGQITLTGSSNIPLNGRSGAAELVAGPAEVTFKRGSSSGRVAISIRQSGREIELEAPVSGDYRSGNFTLRGSEIGQPVDLVSARSHAVTGGTERYTTIEDQGFQTCRVDVSYEPCVESWTVAFKSVAGAELGTFSSRASARCNERRGMPYACWREPRHEPRLPDFPRDRHRLMKAALDQGADQVKFD